MTIPNYSDLDARDIIANEGLEYAVRRYVDADAFQNPETRRLWAAASRALDALAQHLRADDL